MRGKSKYSYSMYTFNKLPRVFSKNERESFFCAKCIRLLRADGGSAVEWNHPLNIHKNVNKNCLSSVEEAKNIFSFK